MQKILKLILLFLLMPCVANAASVEDLLRKEFVEKGIDGDIDFEVYSNTNNVENGMISDLKIDELNNKFTCKVEVLEDGKEASSFNVAGKYYLLEEIYVPAVTIAKGEEITIDKLRKIKIRANRIKPDNVVEEEKLVGLEAKRSLKEGKPILTVEIGSKILVKKGDIVTVIYNAKGMKITARAEVLVDGGKGDKVELINTKSKKTITGEVKDRDTVEVANE